MTIADVTGPSAGADVAWSIQCKQCNGHVARHTQLAFLLQNEAAVHLTLVKSLLVEEVLNAEPEPQPMAQESWCLRSHDHVTPRLQFTKLRTKKASKRAHFPFELFCVRCQAKIGSEGYLDELDDTVLVLDSKSCNCILDQQPAYGGAIPGPKARKWSVILKQLQEMKLPLQIQKLQDLMAGGAQSNNAEAAEVVPLVFPTEASIRSNFSPSGKISRLRHYQVELTLSALLENTIVYLPTGCGKTLVAIKVIEEMKRLNPSRLVVFFVPTGPLVSQQAAYIRRESDFKVMELSGQHSSTSAAATSAIRTDGDVDALVVTPQYFVNLLDHGRTVITDYSTMVFDEAHHAKKKDPYRTILHQLTTVSVWLRPRILGLTASPFGEATRENSGLSALRKLEESFSAVVNAPTIAAEELEASFIPKEAKWVKVEESEPERKLREGLKKYIESFYVLLERMASGPVMPFGGNYDKDDMELTQFLAKLRVMLLTVRRNAIHANEEASEDDHSQIQTDARAKVADRSTRRVTDLELILQHLRKVASCFYELSIHGAGMVATSLSRVFDNLKKPKASEANRRTFALAQASFHSILDPTLTSFPHEKYLGADISKRVHLVAECIRDGHFTHDSRAIVFVRRRRTAILLSKAMEQLEELRELNPTHFVGHNSYEGMSWEEEQKPTLQRFRQGRIRLLVATNVLEEGLDVPECSLVIQFDGVIGVTSLIQSRGRARQWHSTFVIFCAEAGLERTRRLVENEKRLVTMANHAASILPSKATVKRLMEERGELAWEECSHEEEEKTVAMSRRELLHATAGTTYNVVLGGIFRRSGKKVQAYILERVNKFASVGRVDQKLGLCTLAASPGHTIYQSYNALCSRVDFFVGKEPFWVRFENDDLESAASGEFADDVSGVGLRRGMMTPDGAFVELKRFWRVGVLKMQPNALATACGNRQVEFDLRALCYPWAWFDLASKKGMALVYLISRLSPRFYAGDERECTNCQSQSQVYCLELPYSNNGGADLWNLRVYLSKFGIEVRETRVPVGKEKRLLTTKPVFDLKVGYALQCLLSDCSHFTNGHLSAEFYELLSSFDPDVQEKALLSFRPSPEAGSIAHQFKAYMENEEPVLKGLCASTELNSGSVVYKAYVTPSRVVFCPPEPSPANRVFRHWGSENFLYVYFRDENMERLDFSDKNILQHVQRVLLRGVTVPQTRGDQQQGSNSLKFRFLGCSLSQVRNSSAIFTLLDPHKIRLWVGDLTSLKSPAKYLKRLGQAFSSTREAFQINQDILDYPKKDIQNERYVFTDGCGEISPEGAANIVVALKLGFTPSAFQIRVGGAKGVVVISDLGEAARQGLEASVVLRESMSKFPSRHNMLEIVAYAGKSEAYLTRQSVLILHDLGIDEDVFMEMQEEFLDELQALVASDAGAFYELKAVLPSNTMWWVDILVRQLGVKMLTDEYLASLARTIYHYRLANTVMRARIPIKKGRTLMGVADFTGTLQYGEVFVQYTETDETSGESRWVTLEDIDVTVHRSPCHHPGDIRVLRCRHDVPPQLKRLKDCIVFPCTGPRPHPDECTGGDLDGDMFVVIWDERLIPAREQVAEPMVFKEEAPGTNPDGGEYYQPTDDSGLISFYVHSIQDDILGVASNAHLALCDARDAGSFDEDAKALARICSKQVDSLRAKEDLEIVRTHAPKVYPDFMQNKDKPYYVSHKVLGKMFRRCKAIMDTTMVESVSRMPVRDDQFLVAGYTDYVAQASILYRQYKLRVRALLRMSGAHAETELATGMIVEPLNVYKADYFRFGVQCKDAFSELQASFRREFDAMMRDLGSDEPSKMAAACYFVAYNDSDATARCLSFAWVVIDLLVTNKASHVGESPRVAWTPVRSSVYAETIPKLQLCLLAEVVTSMEELLSDLFDRLVAVSLLRSAMPACLKKKELDLVLFGSSALLTFEKQSDLDVMVCCNSHRGSLKAIAKALEGVHGNVDLKDDIRVPLLSFSFHQWSVELCKTSNGPLKTRLFRTYMARYDFFWLCVHFLVRWGKCVGLIRRRSGGGHDMFSPTGFIWLFIRFCTEKGFVQPISSGEITLKQIRQTNDIDSEIAFWTAHLTQLVSGNDDVSALSAAEVLLSFLTYYAKLSTPNSAFGFYDPLDPENDTQLDDDGIALFRSECHIAVHQLVIAKGDINYLLSHRQQQTSKITLTHALSLRVHEAKDFFSRKILFETKTESSTRLRFTPHPNALRSDLYVAEIMGSGDAVQRIESHIRMIEQELGAGMTHRPKHNFHREGSSLLLFEGALSQSEKIGFQAYFGNRHVEHNNIPLHQAHLICFMNGREWYEHAAATFCAKFVQQMVKLSRYEHLNPGASKATAFVRFGHHYLIHLPRSFDEETIMLASIKKLEDEFERGRTARELYESVLVAKHKQRTEAADENATNGPKVVSASDTTGEKGEESEWSELDEDGKGRPEYDEDGEDYSDNDNEDEDGGGGGGGGGGGESTYNRRRRMPRMSLKNASTLARGDKGVTHSFYSMIETQHAEWAEEYSKEHKAMTLHSTSNTYQVSIVHQGFEFNVTLTADLQLVKIKTRPERWFSTTLKMRQELDEESDMMDATPDVRYYVSTTEEVPKTHEVYVKLATCCEKAPDGRGVLEFCGPEGQTQDKVRISRYLLDAGESSASLATVRHVRGNCYYNAETELQLSLMRIREFGIPDRNPDDGFLNVSDKVEAEFRLPPLTPERRLRPAFAREFLAMGVDFVDFLRAEMDRTTPDL